MKRCIKRCSIVFAGIVLIGGIVFEAVQFWEGRGEGFRVYKIQSQPPYEQRWDISYTDEELSTAVKALAQPYTYLAHGFQCYAFMSQDGEYVLKFFRHQRLRLPDLVMRIPNFPFFNEWRKAKILALSRRKEYLLRSCKTSWTLAKEETQLLMVHLNRTEDIFPTVTIIDPFGEKHPIKLDEYQFLLQRRAEKVKPTFISLMKNNDVSGAKARIDQIFELFLTCAAKGIQDTDGALVRKDNLGFFHDKAIYIDGGKLQMRKGVFNARVFRKDLRRLRPLKKWMEIEYPELASYFKTAQAAAIETIRQKEDQESVCLK